MRILKLTLSSLALIVFINNYSFSQSHPNSIYFEALGNGALYSLNYDRLFTENFGGRIGIMYLSSFDMIFTSAENLLLIPVMLNYFSGSEHKLEIGAGVVIVSADYIGFFGLGSGGTGIGGTATLGYRYQQTDGGFLFRAGFTPFFGEGGFQPSGGLSIGFSF